MLNRIYFIQANPSGLIKIGQTRTSVEQRLAALQTGSAEQLKILATTDNHSEKILHQRFHTSRVRGEWFTPTTDLLDFIREISSADSETYNCHICNKSVVSIGWPKGWEGWDSDDICYDCASSVYYENIPC